MIYVITPVNLAKKSLKNRDSLTKLNKISSINLNCLRTSKNVTFFQCILTTPGYFTTQTFKPKDISPRRHFTPRTFHPIFESILACSFQSIIQQLFPFFHGIAHNFKQLRLSLLTFHFGAFLHKS